MRAIFLDRDGVICENRSDYVKNWNEFKFLADAKNSLAALSRLGLPIIVVTNQSAIGRGIICADVVEDIHHRMVTEVAAHGGRIDRVMYCPHSPDESCECRKPKPGLLLQAAQEMDLDLSQSYLVGDAASDVMAGNGVGCRTFLVLTGRGIQQLIPTLGAAGGKVTIARTLTEATTQILKAELAISDGADRWNRVYTQLYQQWLPNFN